MTAFYEEDLALIHHAGFSDFAGSVGADLVALFVGAGIDAGTAGAWAKRLVRAGFIVEGFDVSEAGLELARRTAPEAPKGRR